MAEGPIDAQSEHPAILPSNPSAQQALRDTPGFRNLNLHRGNRSKLLSGPPIGSDEEGVSCDTIAHTLRRSDELREMSRSFRIAARSAKTPAESHELRYASGLYGAAAVAPLNSHGLVKTY